MVTKYKQAARKKATPKKGNKDAITIVKTHVETLWLPDDMDGNHVPLYRNSVQWVVRRGPSEMTDRQLLIATVLATEAIADEEELLGALAHLKEIERDDDGPYVSWTEDKVTHRIRLSSFTCLAAAKIKEWPQNWDTECNAFFKGVVSKLKLAPLCEEVEFVAKFFILAQSWYQYILPAPCANHLSNTLPLTLLPQDVLARRVGIRPIALTDRVDAGELSPLADAAVDQLYGADLPKRKSPAVVAALKGLFRGDDRDSVRLANYLEKRDVQAELTLLSGEILRSGCPVSAILVLWIVHLLEWGSVRLKNPTTGTIRAYVFSIMDRLYEALLALNCSPIDVSQEQWAGFFANLMNAEDMDNVAKNALLSFHRCLVLQLGIQPVVGILNLGAEAGVPSANFLWPHEREHAFALIPTFTADPRLIKMLGAMLAMGLDQTVRIGELPGMRRKCVNTNDGNLRIDFYPAHGQHRGKSRAATKPLDYTDSPYRAYIDDWINYRDCDGLESVDELIFGDPNRPGKCYLLGLCLRTLNKILKEATGDEAASFHMLRHTQICIELTQDLIKGAAPTAVKKSDQLAAGAGHKNDLTTYICYFHTPEVVMRFWIDRELENYRNSPEVVGSWLGKAPNSLTKARSRHGSDGKYLGNLLDQAAKQVTPSTINEPLLDVVPARPLLSIAIGAGSFRQVLYVLNTLCAGKPLNVIASRNDTTPDRIVGMCRVIVDVANQVVSHFKRVEVSKNANGDVVLQTARTLIETAHCHYPLNEAILASPLDALMFATEPTDTICAAAMSWVATKQGKYISLTKTDSVVPLVSFLVEAGVPPANFIVNVAVDDPLKPGVAEEVLRRPDVLNALSIFERLSGASPQVVAVSFAKGRPDLYLMLSRNRVTGEKVCAPAETRTNRLHALMLAIMVWIKFSRS